MKLFLIRHAESMNNKIFNDFDYEEYLKNRTADPSITDLGRQQAKLLADYLQNNNPPEQRLLRTVWADDQDNPNSGYSFTKLYCSPMLRTLQTTWPVSQALGLMPEIWTDIFEFGGLFHRDGEENVNYPGLTAQEMADKFPGYTIPAAVTDQGWWYDGQEEEEAAHTRVQRVAKQILAWADQEAYQEERIAMIIHGTLMSYLIKALVERNVEPNPDSDTINRTYYHHYNTAISRIDFLPDGSRMLRYLNRTAHLESSMVSV